MIRVVIRVGDRVTRLLAGQIPMELTVAAIDDRFIYCGPEPEPGVAPADYPGWKFDKTYGYEVDEDLGWGVPHDEGGIITGSYLLLENEEGTYAPASASESNDLPVHRAAGEGPEVV